MTNLKELIKKIFNREPESGMMTISAKVYRADKGKWYDLGVVSKGKIDFKTSVD